MPGIFVYGEIGVDNLIAVPHLPTAERAAFPTSDIHHIGGAGANVAVMLANWGVPVALSGNAIGDDLFGTQLRGWLGKYPALDLRSLEIIPGSATPFCRILVLPSGERAIMVFGYPQTHKTALTPAMLEGVKFMALDLYGGPERRTAAEVARQQGVRTAIGDLIWPDHALLPLADILTNSAAYIRQEFPGVDPREHAAALQARSGGLVVTTDGGRPVHVLDRDGSAFLVTPPKVPVVDATGAGDAFKAGLLYGLSNGLELPRAVCWAVAAGALKVGRLGAVTHPPAAAEVEQLAATLRPEAVGPR
jgi:sugar/nucleoside kinase (ribokinase family)